MMDPIDTYINTNWKGKYNEFKDDIKIQMLEILKVRKIDELRNLYNPNNIDRQFIAKECVKTLGETWDTESLIYFIQRSLLYTPEDEQKNDTESNLNQVTIISEELKELIDMIIEECSNIDHLNISISLNISKAKKNIQKEAISLGHQIIDLRLLYNWTKEDEVCEEILKSNFDILSPNFIINKKKKKMYDSFRIRTLSDSRGAEIFKSKSK